MDDNILQQTHTITVANQTHLALLHACNNHMSSILTCHRQCTIYTNAHIPWKQQQYIKDKETIAVYKTKQLERRVTQN